MKTKMKRLMLLISLLLAACGGGTSKPVVAFYGDSITYGTHSADYNVWTPVRWNPSPVEHIAALADIEALDYSVDGSSAVGARLRSDNSSVVVIRYGVADRVRDIHPETFKAGITSLVNEAKSKGKRVILTGLPHTAGLDTSALNYIMMECAVALNVEFIDIHSLPFDAATDLADAIHPAEGYSRRIGETIAKYLKEHNG